MRRTSESPAKDPGSKKKTLSAALTYALIIGMVLSAIVWIIQGKATPKEFPGPDIRPSLQEITGDQYHRDSAFWGETLFPRGSTTECFPSPDWSLLCEQDKDEFHLVRIARADGSRRILRRWKKAQLPGSLEISPDGKWASYSDVPGVAYEDLNRRFREGELVVSSIHVIPLEAKGPERVWHIQHNWPGRLFWRSDGKAWRLQDMVHTKDHKVTNRLMEGEVSKPGTPHVPVSSPLLANYTAWMPDDKGIWSIGALADGASLACMLEQNSPEGRRPISAAAGEINLTSISPAVTLPEPGAPEGTSQAGQALEEDAGKQNSMRGRLRLLHYREPDTAHILKSDVITLPKEMTPMAGGNLHITPDGRRLVCCVSVPPKKREFGEADYLQRDLFRKPLHGSVEGSGGCAVWVADLQNGRWNRLGKWSGPCSANWSRDGNALLFQDVTHQGTSRYYRLRINP